MKCQQVSKADELSYKAAKISDAMFPVTCKTCAKRGHKLFVTDDCLSLLIDDVAFIKTTLSKKAKRTFYSGLIAVVKSCCFCCVCTACVARVNKFVERSGGGGGGGEDEEYVGGEDPVNDNDVGQEELCCEPCGRHREGMQSLYTLPLTERMQATASNYELVANGGSSDGTNTPFNCLSGI